MNQPLATIINKMMHLPLLKRIKLQSRVFHILSSQHSLKEEQDKDSQKESSLILHRRIKKSYCRI